MGNKTKSDVCIFTIVSNNYLHYANTLFESLTKHCPQADLTLGLCDLTTDKTKCLYTNDTIPIDQLNIPNLGTFIYQYSILELNTAIKPYIFEALMSRGYKKIIYFDPDILIFSSLQGMLKLLDKHNILLTPHLTDLLDDGKAPGELQIIQAGSYNLGYIGIRNCDETLKMVRWWQRKLYKECVVDIPCNLFVDQKWMDLVPSMFDGVYINRDTSWNVAYWNLNHRALEKITHEQYKIDGDPLTFFHFSGFSIEASELSKHQNRFTKGQQGTPLRELCSLYESTLKRNGIDNFKHLPYAFSKLSDGTPVPDSARRLIRTNKEFEKFDFFDPKDCIHIHNELNRSTDNHRNGVLLTCLAQSLWQSRENLRNAFPRIKGQDSERFAEWLLNTGHKEANFSDIYLAPIRASLELMRSTEKEPPIYSRNSIINYSLQFIWKNKHRIPLKLRIALGPYVGWMFNKAKPQTQLPAKKLQPKAPKLPNSELLGINLIGYLHAESGVGEAARASLRSLKKSDLPYSLVDYRHGNISRMKESVDSHLNKAYYPINLLQVNADQTKITREVLGEGLFKNRYTIGYWYWEMPKFPEFLHFAFSQVDEVWVSTEFNRKSISEFTDKPVNIIPPAIEVNIQRPMTRQALHLPEDEFIFLHMSDVLSIPQRKNPLGVVEAFLRAFGEKPEVKVRLLIKLSNLEHQAELSESVYTAAKHDHRIQIINKYLDRNTLNNLINNCDCYVSLHRAEGFGLPLAEAMYLGKPVIATNWSGNIDFMNIENSYPVNYKLVTLEEDIGPYHRGQIWAEPDVTHASTLMNTVLVNSKASALAKQASLDIRKNYSPVKIAKTIESRAKAILGKGT
ncbi:glycosyltransferase family 4 protein [Gilvimarinus sp. 1_MG-2023]|uniref:glycosyltransferase family 4 protein n=1 Tax=Gilvimarinus sp. 1_MG-2023 TaxID=3062638 RepID=UPI0026E4291B|nr:glycosyltransferase family 4 protein [Gilvimarinus sp. 1_MG-2023]MDO6746306.1 glycosyltransferase family 4 protein [Gilvimarinus sp. 1_MG-2023]